MTRLSRQRIIGISLAVLAAFFLTNYYFDLGFFGRGAKGLLILTIGIGVVWGAYFAPTRQELSEDHERRRAKKKKEE